MVDQFLTNSCKHKSSTLPLSNPDITYLPRPPAAPNTSSSPISKHQLYHLPAYFGGDALANPVPALGGNCTSVASSMGSQVHQSSLAEVSMTLETWEPQPVQDLWWQIPQIAGEHIFDNWRKKEESGVFYSLTGE